MNLVLLGQDLIGGKGDNRKKRAKSLLSTHANIKCFNKDGLWITAMDCTLYIAVEVYDEGFSNL